MLLNDFFGCLVLGGWFFFGAYWYNNKRDAWIIGIIMANNNNYNNYNLYHGLLGE